MSEWGHTSVLLFETVDAVAPAPGDVCVDCTLGMGGHTEAMLERADCTVYGIDRDEDALRIAKARLARFGDRFVPIHGRFGDVQRLLASRGVHEVNVLIADLGVSSVQLDRADRGFAHRLVGPVDMRMDRSTGLSAAEWLDACSLDDLVSTLRDYGDEPHARKVARVILDGRPWSDTAALAAAIDAAVPRGRRAKIHPATRAFQAIRIAVNDELGELHRMLGSLHAILAPGARLGIISFHSLEDRKVKHWISDHAGWNAARDPFGDPIVAPTFDAPRRAVHGADDANPRARSARLRTARRRLS